MLSIIIDIGGGYLVAKFVKNIWLALLAAIVVGIGSAVGANMLIYATASDVFTPGEIGMRIASGIIIHPVVTIVSLVIFRKKLNRASKDVAAPQGEES